MGRIKRTDIYPIKPNPHIKDYVVGSDYKRSGKTVNFEVGTLLSNSFGGVPDSFISGDFEWVEGTLSFNFTELVYRKNDRLYSTLPTTITLDNGGVLPRKDIIAVTIDEEVVVIKGQESITPAEPVLPNTTEYLKFTVIDIAAGATVPTGVSTEKIFDEGIGEPTEWTTTENTGGSRVIIPSDEESNTFLKSIKIINPNLVGDIITFTNNVEFPVNIEDRLQLYIKLTSEIKLNSGFSVSLYKGATKVSNDVLIIDGLFNFYALEDDSYQLVSVPIGSFILSDVEYNVVKFELTGFDNDNKTLYIDTVNIISGLGAITEGINHSELSLDDGTNPHGTTKNDVGLSNVDNTSDLNKPISIPTQYALDLKLEVESDPIFSSSPSFGITNLDITNWSTAFSWGNHAGLYLPIGTFIPTQYTDEMAQDAIGGILNDTLTIEHIYNDGLPTIEFNVRSGSIGSTQLTTATNNNIASGITAFGWGDHAGLYSLLGHTHTFASLTFKPTTIAGYGITDSVTLNTTQSISGNKTFNGNTLFDYTVALPTPFYSEDFSVSLGDFTTSGDSVFTRVTDDGNGDLFSARSGAIGNNEISILTLNKLTTEQFTLCSFDYKVSTEENFDWLFVVLDGQLIDRFSGINAWTTRQFYIEGVGAHEIKFIYFRDHADNGGTNQVWIDNVKLYNYSIDVNVAGSINIEDELYVTGNSIFKGKAVYNNELILNSEFHLLNDTTEIRAARIRSKASSNSFSLYNQVGATAAHLYSTTLNNVLEIFSITTEETLIAQFGNFGEVASLEMRGVTAKARIGENLGLDPTKMLVVNGESLFRDNVNVTGNITATSATLTSILSVSTDTDKFLVSDGGIVKYRTGVELLSDIGASSTSHNHSLNSLSNVIITANSSGELLKWNGSAWINNTLVEAGIQASGDFLTANIADTKTTGNLIFNDNIRIAFGTSSGESSLYSNATNTLFDLISGDFLIRDNTSTRFTFGRTTGDFLLSGDITQTGTQSQMDIDPYNNIRLGRTTNNAAFALNILRGDNTTTVNHKLTGVGDSYLAGNNGNVGIGKTTPEAKLDIYETTTPTLQYSNTFTPLNGAYKVITEMDSGHSFRVKMKRAGEGGGLGSFYVTAGLADTVKFAVNGNSGNVSIGNTNDTHKLDVSGTGRFTEDLRVGTSSSSSQSYLGNLSGFAGLWLGTNATTPSFSNYSILDDSGVLTAINSTGTVSLRVNNTAVINATATAININQNTILPYGSSIYLGGITNSGADGVRIFSNGDNSYIDVKGGVGLNFRINDVDGGNQHMRLNTSGNLSIGLNNNNDTYKLDVSGTGRFTGDVTATNFILSSDERLKQNIEIFDDSKHIEISVKEYELKSEPNTKRVGVIAQELEKTNPEFVRTDAEGFKSVAYIDLLIAKIAELEARLEKAGI